MARLKLAAFITLSLTALIVMNFVHEHDYDEEGAGEVIREQDGGVNTHSFLVNKGVVEAMENEGAGENIQAVVQPSHKGNTLVAVKPITLQDKFTPEDVKKLATTSQQIARIHANSNARKRQQDDVAVVCADEAACEALRRKASGTHPMSIKTSQHVLESAKADAQIAAVHKAYKNRQKTAQQRYVAGQANAHKVEQGEKEAKADKQRKKAEQKAQKKEKAQKKTVQKKVKKVKKHDAKKVKKQEKKQSKALKSEAKTQKRAVKKEKRLSDKQQKHEKKMMVATESVVKHSVRAKALQGVAKVADASKTKQDLKKALEAAKEERDELRKAVRKEHKEQKKAAKDKSKRIKVQKQAAEKKAEIEKQVNHFKKKVGKIVKDAKDAKKQGAVITSSIDKKLGDANQEGVQKMAMAFRAKQTKAKEATTTANETKGENAPGRGSAQGPQPSPGRKAKQAAKAQTQAQSSSQVLTKERKVKKADETEIWAHERATKKALDDAWSPSHLLLEADKAVHTATTLLETDVDSDMSQHRKTKHLFDRFDSNGDGELSHSELQHTVTRFLAPPGRFNGKVGVHAVMAELMQRHDTNHDARMDFREWHRMLTPAAAVHDMAPPLMALQTAASECHSEDCMQDHFERRNKKALAEQRTRERKIPMLTHLFEAKAHLFARSQELKMALHHASHLRATVPLTTLSEGVEQAKQLQRRAKKAESVMMVASKADKLRQALAGAKDLKQASKASTAAKMIPQLRQVRARVAQLRAKLIAARTAQARTEKGDVVEQKKRARELRQALEELQQETPLMFSLTRKIKAERKKAAAALKTVKQHDSRFSAAIKKMKAKALRMTATVTAVGEKEIHELKAKNAAAYKEVRQDRKKYSATIQELETSLHKPAEQKAVQQAQAKMAVKNVMNRVNSLMATATKLKAKGATKEKIAYLEKALRKLHQAAPIVEKLQSKPPQVASQLALRTLSGTASKTMATKLQQVQRRVKSLKARLLATAKAKKAIQKESRQEDQHHAADLKQAITNLGEVTPLMLKLTAKLKAEKTKAAAQRAKAAAAEEDLKAEKTHFTKKIKALKLAALHSTAQTEEYGGKVIRELKGKMARQKRSMILAGKRAFQSEASKLKAQLKANLQQAHDGKKAGDTPSADMMSQLVAPQQQQQSHLKTQLNSTMAKLQSTIAAARKQQSTNGDNKEDKAFDEFKKFAPNTVAAAQPQPVATAGHPQKPQQHAIQTLKSSQDKKVEDAVHNMQTVLDKERAFRYAKLAKQLADEKAATQQRIAHVKRVTRRANAATLKAAMAKLNTAKAVVASLTSKVHEEMLAVKGTMSKAKEQAQKQKAKEDAVVKKLGGELVDAHGATDKANQMDKRAEEKVMKLEAAKAATQKKMKDLAGSDAAKLKALGLEEIDAWKAAAKAKNQSSRAWEKVKVLSKAVIADKLRTKQQQEADKRQQVDELNTVKHAAHTKLLANDATLHKAIKMLQAADTIVAELSGKVKSERLKRHKMVQHHVSELQAQNLTEKQVEDKLKAAMKHMNGELSEDKKEIGSLKDEDGSLKSKLAKFMKKLFTEGGEESHLKTELHDAVLQLKAGNMTIDDLKQHLRKAAKKAFEEEAALEKDRRAYLAAAKKNATALAHEKAELSAEEVKTRAALKALRTAKANLDRIKAETMKSAADTRLKLAEEKRMLEEDVKQTTAKAAADLAEEKNMLEDDARKRAKADRDSLLKQKAKLDLDTATRDRDTQQRLNDELKKLRASKMPSPKDSPSSQHVAELESELANSKAEMAEFKKQQDIKEKASAAKIKKLSFQVMKLQQHPGASTGDKNPKDSPDQHATMLAAQKQKVQHQLDTRLAAAKQDTEDLDRKIAKLKTTRKQSVTAVKKAVQAAAQVAASKRTATFSALNAKLMTHLKRAIHEAGNHQKEIKRLRQQLQDLAAKKLQGVRQMRKSLDEAQVALSIARKQRDSDKKERSNLQRALLYEVHLAIQRKSKITELKSLQTEVAKQDARLDDAVMEEDLLLVQEMDLPPAQPLDTPRKADNNLGAAILDAKKLLGASSVMQRSVDRQIHQLAPHLSLYEDKAQTAATEASLRAAIQKALLQALKPVRRQHQLRIGRLKSQLKSQLGGKL